MGFTVRKTSAQDVQPWLDLLTASLGPDYPDKQAYDPAWVLPQISPSADTETWIVDSGGRIDAAISFLPASSENVNPIANLGRLLIRPDADGSGAGDALLRHIVGLASERKQIVVLRVLASDNAQQALLEKHGFVCCGFQPFKHLTRVREGCLFYVRAAPQFLGARQPISESLPQVTELATVVLSALGIPDPITVRDGAVGYSLQSELKFSDATVDDFELWRMQAQFANPPIEISGSFNLGFGYLRTPSDSPAKAVLAQRDDKIVAGLAYHFDSIDRCVRLVNSFAQDELSMGALIKHALALAQQQHSAVYVEVDILMTAPRLMKSAEQLGFVPIAYLPAFFVRDGTHTDVVKMVKLNMVYSLDNATFTSHARKIVEIIDHNFQDQKVGVAIINLLRALPIFEGLGDGELRKMARLFTQKLYRGGERIFGKGDSGNEAYVVMRGQIDILLDEASKPIASLGNGQIFGELAFLDGAARVAIAMARQPSILLVIQRSAFYDLARQEPHLGMVVMRNVAMELSNRLRKANAAMAPAGR